MRFRTWQVVFVQFFKTKIEAMDFEKYLKSSMGREWIRRNLPFE
ncbi:GIY-YIG nuclease family protein [Aequorivita todarodis]